MSSERVQKILAQSGIASRRKAEELIAQGAVTINGKVAQLGDKAELGKDAIKVNGKLLQATVAAPVYVAFHKPKNVISMMADPEGRPTLVDYLSKIKARLFPIGRLDFTSEGLLLLTNDGQFAEKLSRRDDIPRVYHVKIKGHPTAEMLSRIQKGGRLGNRFVKPHSVRIVEEFTQKARVEIVILDSGAIDIRALLESRGFLVDRIVRTAIGHITLGPMLPGAYRLLTKSQVEALLEQPELGMRRLEQEAAENPIQPREEMGHVDELEPRSEERSAGGWRAPTRDEMKRSKPAIAIKFRGDRRDGGGDRREGGGERKPRFDRGDRPQRAERAERGDRPQRSFGGEKRGGFGASRGPKRDSGFGAPREKREGFGASRGPKRDSGFGAPREKREGFGASRGPKRDSGFGAPREKREGFGASRGPKRDSGFGAPREKREGFGASRGPKRDSGFGAPRGEKRGFGGKKPFGGGSRTGGKPAPRGKRPPR